MKYVLIGLFCVFSGAALGHYLQANRDAVLAKAITVAPDRIVEILRNRAMSRSIKKVERMYGGRIKLASDRTKVPSDLITAMIVVESGGNDKAFSKSKAMGLMQLKRLTAKVVEVDPWHPYENIVGGARYIKLLQDKYGFIELEKMLLAYNRGPTAAKRILATGFKPETDRYVRKVKAVINILRSRKS